MVIRSKFRCVEQTRHVEQAEVWRFRPVYPKGCAGPDGECEENRQFWDATPSGELVVRGPAEPFVLGDFYFIDATPAEAGEFKLYRCQQHGTAGEGGTLDVALGLRWDDARQPQHVDYTMGILNASAWTPFLEAGEGSRWRVEIIRA